jgi:hypothetical protein
MPSSHAMMEPSLLSSSLSWARSFSYSSSSTADVTTAPGGGEDLHPKLNHDQGHREKQAHAITGVD